MMVGDPCPMHKYFHTILGLMDAQDPLLSCVHHGMNHLPWAAARAHAEPFDLISLLWRGGSPMDALRSVNGKLLPLGLPSVIKHLVNRMVYAGQKRVLGIHKTQNGVEMLMHRAWVTHHHCPLAL